MFSVIIPLYNKAAYINKAVNSVLNQTFSDFELIVVNDGSTDDSLNRIKHVKDDRLKIITQQNAGVSTARNNGVKKAKYDYITFLDADDWWEEVYLEEMNALIKKYPDAGLYGANYKQVKYGIAKEANIGVEEGFIDGYINYFDVYAKTMWMPLYSSSVVISKKVFNALGGFKPILKLGEDFDLWVRIAIKYKVAFLNKPLVYYNQDVDLSNRAVNPKKLYETHTHFIFQLNYLKEEENNPSLKNLLDKLRVYCLFRYYISKSYEKETHEILSKVDFSKQPLSVRLKYKVPLPVLKFYHICRKRASEMKQSILRVYYFRKERN